VNSLGDPLVNVSVQPDWLEILQLLIARLVHEFRNPLSGILASSQLLARLVDPSSPAREYAQIVEEEARTLERFLARLAEFGRLRMGEPCVAGSVDVHALLVQALREIKAECETGRVRQVATFDPRVREVRGEPTRLGRACAEILRNALEAMPDGGTLTISTRLAPADGGQSGKRAIRQSGEAENPDRIGVSPDRRSAREWIEVEFADTGAGMTEEARQHAFEPFFSTRPRALGIGLSLAQAIACAHEGHLRLGPLTGQGVRVILALPAAAARRNDH
jgi:signal transduction histidine kinase